MKNYELIERLMKLPAGYDIEFYRASDDEVEMVLEDIGDAKADESEQKITLLCG